MTIGQWCFAAQVSQRDKHHVRRLPALTSASRPYRGVAEAMVAKSRRYLREVEVVTVRGTLMRRAFARCACLALALRASALPLPTYLLGRRCRCLDQEQYER